MSWTCPHCNMLQIVTGDMEDQVKTFHSNKNGSFQNIGFCLETIKCANPSCAKFSFSLMAGAPRKQIHGSYNWNWSGALYSGQVYPSPSGKPQPNYIPKAIVEDYQEACLIKDLSPKASAALARRAVQGIIRDFAGVRKGTLNAEITELKAQVDSGKADRSISLEAVEAIDHIRSVGNIGAHMEKDVNLIIDVAPDEAEQMIAILELLFQEFYVARHNRADRLARMKEIADTKKAEKEVGQKLISGPPSSDVPEE